MRRHDEDGGDESGDPLGTDRTELRHAHQDATAIRVGTASTEAILRCFTRNASHAVHQAICAYSARLPATSAGGRGLAQAGPLAIGPGQPVVEVGAVLGHTQIV